MTEKKQEELIKQIKNLISKLDFSTEPIMEYPKNGKIKMQFGECNLDEVRHSIEYGENMHTHFHGVSDEDVWCYPDGVEEKIQDNKRYEVFYTRHDASDPADFGSFYKVYYVREISQAKIDFLKYLEKTIKDFKK